MVASDEGERVLVHFLKRNVVLELEFIHCMTASKITKNANCILIRRHLVGRFVSVKLNANILILIGRHDPFDFVIGCNILAVKTNELGKISRLSRNERFHLKVLSELVIPMVLQVRASAYEKSL